MALIAVFAGVFVVFAGAFVAILASRNFPNAQIDAVDLSRDALAVAARNVADYGLQDRITLHRGDLFGPLAGRRYDLMLDLIGNRPLSSCRRALTPSGTFVMLGGRSGRWIRPMDRVIETLVLSRFVRQRLVLGRAVWSYEDLLLMQHLMAAGRVSTVIDRTYPLSQVPEAIRYLEEGHARGKVVITIGDAGDAK